MKKKQHFTNEQKVFHRFLLHTTKTQDIGLFSGKMGAILLLYEYDKYFSRKVCSKLADNLLDKVWNKITKTTPISFSEGIYGIGWAIEYLIQKGFVEGVGADISEDINLRIMQEDPRRIADLSLETGLCGLLHYLLIHIKGCREQKTKLIFDGIYLNDIYQLINSIPTEKVNIELKNLIYLYNKFFTKGMCNYLIDLAQFVKADKESERGEIHKPQDSDTHNPETITPKDKLSIGLRYNIAYPLIQRFIN